MKSSKKFIKQETAELVKELTRIKAAFNSDQITWEDYLLLKIKAYRDFVKQTNQHLL